MRYVQKKFVCKCGLVIYKCLSPHEINTLTKLPCKCGKKAKRIDMGFKTLNKNTNTMGALHAEGGVRVFEKGKRKTLETKRAVKEYEKRNDCVFGSDDLEQEAEHNREVMDKEYTKRVTNNVMSDFERLQRQKKASK